MYGPRNERGCEEEATMGASEFMTTAKGRTAEEAFRAAREDALYEYGHGGYTGSVGEKSDFVMIREDGRSLKARLDGAIDGLRALQRELRGSGKPAISDALLGLQRRLDVYLFVDEYTLRHGSKAQAQKILKGEIARLRAMRARCKARMKPEEIASILIDICDRRIDDKWGPAGCFDLTPNRKRDKEFLFFGMASC